MAGPYENCVDVNCRRNEKATTRLFENLDISSPGMAGPYANCVDVGGIGNAKDLTSLLAKNNVSTPGMAGPYANIVDVGSIGNANDLTCLFAKNNVSTPDTKTKFSSSAGAPLPEIINRKDCRGSAGSAEGIRHCEVCDKDGHQYSFECPYFKNLLRGAKYNRGYQPVCKTCSNLFNEKLWVCVSCGYNGAVLQEKFCSICRTRAHHGLHECPKDPVLAERYRLVYEKMMVPSERVPCTPPPGSQYSPPRRPSLEHDTITSKYIASPMRW